MGKKYYVYEYSIQNIDDEFLNEEKLL